MYTETWEAPSGALLPPRSREQVDEKHLAELYAAETQPDSARFNALYEGADNATRLAWSLGYRNPRVPGRIAECEALA
ncbi:hypothetical protein SEA_SUNFLOWER1121_80 [Mycobacterium Phage Sunflower1121]|nr:hypothetical protein SEA_SUNFLOWER1121_80 [Mycobacterium Phage Sunflower1121]WNM67557.1 hypothetical protein SEA_SHADOW1_79 [Mycobacterium phage Shadow1]